MNDKELAEKILEGDQSCWKNFVEKYTDWVLYTVWEFERKFCNVPAKSKNCSLLFIMHQRKGERTPYLNDTESCDEGIELYLWLLRHLKGRLKSYRGKSKLSTYIWTILHSKNLHVDILRWKYGRVDENNTKRLPAAIQKLPETERRLFVMLRMKKDEASIRRQLELDPEDFQRAFNQVQEALLHAGQVDLIERPELKDFEPWDAEHEKQFKLYGPKQDQEGVVIDQLFLRQVVDHIRSNLNKLKPAEQKLLKLYYHEGLSGKEIGQFCSQLLPSPLEIDGVPVNSKNVYYLLGKVTDRLVSGVNIEFNGQRLSDKQWMKALIILGQEGIW